MVRRMLVSLIVALSCAVAAVAEPPGMSTNILGIEQLNFEDCKARVASALRTRGYGKLFDTGNGYTATNARFASSVTCIQSRPGVVLNVVVASNDAETRAECDRLLDLVRDGGRDDGNESEDTIEWTDSPNSLKLRGKSGTFTFTCPSGGQLRTTWGTDVYTDDSSICTAAVHAGLIRTGRGGTVTIEMLPGRSSYAGTLRYGVTTNSYGAWTSSFSFHGANDRGETRRNTISWSENARAWRGQTGKRIRVSCPADGSANASVWGNRVYTDDSAICVAAVHAGEITLDDGGDVTIEIRGGRDSFEASSRNGISARSYAAWPASFVFVH